MRLLEGTGTPNQDNALISAILVVHQPSEICVDNDARAQMPPMSLRAAFTELPSVEIGDHDTLVLDVNGNVITNLGLVVIRVTQVPSKVNWLAFAKFRGEQISVFPIQFTLPACFISTLRH